MTQEIFSGESFRQQRERLVLAMERMKREGHVFSGFPLTCRNCGRQAAILANFQAGPCNGKKESFGLLLDRRDEEMKAKDSVRWKK